MLTLPRTPIPPEFIPRSLSLSPSHIGSIIDYCTNYVVFVVIAFPIVAIAFSEA